MNLSLRAKLRLPESCSDEQLQETCNRYYAIYKGVLDSSAAEAVKAVAESKLADLIDHARRESVTLRMMDDVSFETAPANINATVEQELSQFNNGITPEKADYLHKKIAALPHSAKRYYLSALVILHRKDAAMDSYREAVTKLKSACSEDPDNLVYQAVLSSIQAEVESYNTQLAAWQKAKQEEIDRAHRISVIKSVLSGIGAVLLWAGGIFLTIAGAVLSCVCGMCDGC